MTNPQTEREIAILTAAMTAFSRYGYARTKMDDIAASAGVARTALYKSFSNKQHIFRSLAAAVHAEALEAARTALSADGPFPDRLTRALIERDRHLLSVGHTGPHADEIAELYLSLASDLAEDSNTALVELIAREVRKAIKVGAFELRSTYKSAKDFAKLLRLALEGIKKEVKSPDEFERLAQQLIGAMI